MAPCVLGTVAGREALSSCDYGGNMPYAVLLVRPMALLYLCVEVLPEGVEGGAEGAGDWEDVFGCGVGLPDPYRELPAAWETVFRGACAWVVACVEAWRQGGVRREGCPLVCGLELGCAASKAKVEVEGCLVGDLVLLKCLGVTEGWWCHM